MNRSSVRHALRVLSFTFAGLLPSVGGAAEPLGAEYSASSGSRLGPPPALRAVPEPGPELEGEEWGRQTWLLEVSGGPALTLCPEYDADCRQEGGWSAAAVVQSRPLTWFSWGPFYQHAQHSEVFSTADWQLRRGTRSHALGLAGRLWFSDQDRFDPYVQVAAGLGHVARRAAFGESDGASTGSGGQSTDAVPLYGVSAGLAIHVSSAIRVGIELEWNHWLLQDWERCPVLTGVCVTPPLRAYDPANGVLALGISLGVSFGSRL